MANQNIDIQAFPPPGVKEGREIYKAYREADPEKRRKQ